jgi:hypothetical protein
VDDSTRTIVGILVGVALLYLGSRIRARSLRRPRPPGPGGGPRA